jgi:16S rRNA (adenine1518-N6/adenine1519-N6)-dimethyltransferase
MSRLPVEWLEGAGLEPPYKVVANIPYYITSLILRRLLEAAAPPTCLVLMVQREVAQNLVAKPPRANLLGISVQYYGAPRIVGTVPAGSFYPRPQVDSAIVRIDVDKSLRPREPEAFFRVVRAGFGGKRKQLKNALAQGLGVTGAQAGHLLLQANVAPERRAETLTLAEWNAVTRAAQTISEPSE